MDGPISIDDARLHMRVTTRDEDENIGRLIRTAALQIETIYGVVAIQRAACFSFDQFKPQLRIPKIPVQPDSVSITYLDSAGAEQELDAFRAFTRDDWTWVTPAIGGRWPATACAPACISVTATIGFINPGQTVEQQQLSVPEDLAQATRLLVEHLFMRSGGPMPAGVDDLIGHYRYRRL